MSNQPLLRRTDVAAILGVHPRTVDANARDGLIPFVTLPSGQRRYRREDVEAFLEHAAPVWHFENDDLLPHQKEAS